MGRYENISAKPERLDFNQNWKLKRCASSSRGVGTHKTNMAAIHVVNQEELGSCIKSGTERDRLIIEKGKNDDNDEMSVKWIEFLRQPSTAFLRTWYIIF